MVGFILERRIIVRQLGYGEFTDSGTISRRNRSAWWGPLPLYSLLEAACAIQRCVSKEKYVSELSIVSQSSMYYCRTGSTSRQCPGPAEASVRVIVQVAVRWQYVNFSWAPLSWSGPRLVEPRRSSLRRAQLARFPAACSANPRGGLGAACRQADLEHRLSLVGPQAHIAVLVPRGNAGRAKRLLVDGHR